MMSSTPAIGIDLGTTNCCVAVFQNGKIEVIPNYLGNRTTPSYVAFTDTGRLIGDEAKNQIEDNPLNTVYDFKQLIGRRFDDSSLQNELKYSFTTFNVMNDKMRPKIMVEHKKKTQTFCPEEILSMLLRKLKRDAEAFLGKSVTNAVIAVPGYFSNYQRQIVTDCAEIACLNVLRIVNDSTIAAMAYGFMDIFDYERNVLIFDLGSHNCNVSIVTIDNGIYEVKATNSERNLGGSSFDTRLVNYFVQKFRNKYRRDISTNKGSIVRLRAACKQAKMELSSAIEAKIEIESLFDGIDFNSSITRVEFEEICADLFRATLDHVIKCLNDSRVIESQIHEIVAIGGSTRIPKIRSHLKSLFTYGRNMITSCAHELVAYGATLQAAILNGDKSETVQNQVLLNVTPHSLGFELPDGTMKIVIKQNTTIPTSKTVKISTFENNQTRMSIQVCEVCENGSINNILGKIVICDIPPKPKGVPQIVVTFDASEYTYLKAHAILKIESTIIRQFDMLPNESNRFCPDKIESMVKKADALDDEDRIAARDSLKSFTQQVVLTVEDVTRKANLQINEMNKWMEQNVDCADENEFKLQRKTLERFCSELGEVLKQLK